MYQNTELTTHSDGFTATNETTNALSSFYNLSKYYSIPNFKTTVTTHNS